jgi:hypothetical protein
MHNTCVVYELSGTTEAAGTMGMCLSCSTISIQKHYAVAHANHMHNTCVVCDL